MTTTEQLFELLTEGTSPFHVVENVEKQLKEQGFLALEFDKAWELKQGNKYYVNHHGSTLFAFTLPKEKKEDGMIRIAAAHTDFPCIRIKPNPEVRNEAYGQVNVEMYGGAILNTWLDRPLSVAGRVAVKSADAFHPTIRHFDAKKPLMTIPNLAIHMNREVNKGVELNRQIDMIPLFTMQQEKEDKKDFFLDYLADQLAVKKEDILDYELSVYCDEKPLLLGGQEEFISAPRLDNLTSVQALTSAITAAERKSGINVIALFDHEEIGSRTKQGAGSLMLNALLDKILGCLGADMQKTAEIKYDSMLLSVDVAHALHPNQMGKMDITNKPVLNGGFCIKEACAQSYATDCESVAIVEQLCRSQNIPYQKFVNRSDMPGGSTLGAIASSLLPVRTVDIGIPLLAMHSARELMGKEDMEALTNLVTEYFRG